MATKTLITMLDDMDGKTENAVTQTFSLNGTSYEIDLCDKNAERLAKALAPFIAKARKRSGTASPAKRRLASVKSEGPSASDIREWAKAQGMPVPERGRIPESVREAYTAASA